MIKKQSGSLKGNEEGRRVANETVSGMEKS